MDGFGASPSGGISCSVPRTSTVQDRLDVLCSNFVVDFHLPLFLCFFRAVQVLVWFVPNEGLSKTFSSGKRQASLNVVHSESGRFNVNVCTSFECHGGPVQKIHRSGRHEDWKKTHRQKRVAKGSAEAMETGECAWKKKNTSKNIGNLTHYTASEEEANRAGWSELDVLRAPTSRDRLWART